MKTIYLTALFVAASIPCHALRQMPQSYRHERQHRLRHYDRSYSPIPWPDHYWYPERYLSDQPQHPHPLPQNYSPIFGVYLRGKIPKDRDVEIQFKIKIKNNEISFAQKMKKYFCCFA